MIKLTIVETHPKKKKDLCMCRFPITLPAIDVQI